MSTRQLASLAAAAALVLLLGVLIRSRLERTNQSAPAAPPSEASALQQLSHEGVLRRASTFVSERASDVSRFVVYVPLSAASGVRWRADTVVSVGLHQPVDVFTTGAVDSSGSPTIRLPGDSIRNDWLLVVGRARNGAVLSLAGAAVGRVRTRCGSRDVDELLLSVPLVRQLAGAGIFDIDGALAGIVIRCGERLAAIPTRQLIALLDRPDSSSMRSEAFGASLTSLDSVARTYFRVDTGALVVAVPQGSIAQTAGLRPGDIVLSIDGLPIAVAPDVTRALAAHTGTAHRIVRLRGRARSVLDVRTADPVRGTEQLALGLGITFPPEPRARGVAVAGIQPGSVAYIAGLRSGDWLTRVGTTDVASRPHAERLLRTAPRGPIFIAFDRDTMEYGALVRR